MKIQALISTMNLENVEKLIKKMNLKTDAIIINQCDREEIQEKKINGKKIKILSYRETGLSKSRNRAIENIDIDTDIAIIADDNVRYVDNYVEIISKAYETNNKDIICFDIKRLDDRKIKKTSVKIGYINSMRISSSQITFKAKKVKNIKFDEMFGIGEFFNMGEENIFLYDALKAGLKIIKLDTIYAQKTNERPSNWYNGVDKKHLYVKGACFYRMSKFFSNILIIQFLIRKKNEYKEKKIGLYKAFKLMLDGKRKYKKIIKTEKRFKVFFLGDFNSNTGPAIANNNFISATKNQVMYVKYYKMVTRFIEMLINTLKSDAVCICSFSKVDFISIRISKILRKKVFYIMHGWIEYETKINGESIEKRNQQERQIIKNVDKIYCVSEIFRNFMLENMPEYKNKFEYVYNGIEWKNISHFKKSNIKKENYQILSTGGLIPIKHNLNVCEAIKKINDNQNKKIKYVIIGKGYGLQTNLQRYDFVEYYEELSYEDVMEKMQESYIYIQNSEFETFGLAVIESLANNCNLLVSKNVGANKIINSLDENDIIMDFLSVDEISKKIRNLFENPNNKRLFESINKEENSAFNRSCELYQKIKKEVQYGE